MIPRPTLRVKVDAVGHGSVFIDGHDISQTVEGMKIEADVGKATTVVLRLLAVELDLDLEGEIETVPPPADPTDPKEN